MNHSYAEPTTGSSNFSFSGETGERIKISFASDIKSGDLNIVLYDSNKNTVYELDKAKEMGYKAVIVEGNPRNYNPRGFETSCNYGIIAGESVHLPSPKCLMVKELQDGALHDIKGTVNYSYYHFLT